MGDTLLTLGVDDAFWTHDRVFNVGGIGTWEHVRPFDIVAPALGWSHERPFNIGRVFAWDHDRPFAIGQTLAWSHDRPFDIVANSGVPGTGSIDPITGAFVPGAVTVYDKNGYPLGTVTEITVPESRSQGIRYVGQMQLVVPITHPDAALLLDDCLISVASSVGLPTWGGSIGRSSVSDGRKTINCPDVGDLFTGFKIEFEEDERELFDGTPATTVYQMIVDRANEIRITHHEVPWSTDFSGVKPFRGDLFEDGEPLDFLELVARRSQTEWATRVDIVAGRFTPVLIVRDEFTAGAGVAFSDGPGGNIQNGSIRYLTDPSAAIRRLKLTGAPTTLTKYMPSWSHWGAHEITPEVELILPDPDPDVPGTPRYREDEEVTVDWGLSKAEQQRIADATVDHIWRLFYSYLYAWHDMMGMPFHPSWAYEGPPEDIEPDLTADKWHTHQEMALYHTISIAHIVMANTDDREWLVVIHFPSGGGTARTVKTVSMDAVYKYPLPKYSSVPVGTTINIYEVVNKTARLFATYTWTDPAETWWLYYPIVVQIQTGRGDYRSMTVRGIVSGPFSGRYVNTSEAPWTFGYAPEGASIDDDTELVTKVWYFERNRVGSWDPRRDGVGEYLSRETIWNGNLTTRARWHVVPFSVGDASSTRLIEGVYHYDTTIFVESVDGWPTKYPFTIRVGDEILGFEDMLVLNAFGGRLDVRRGTSLLTTLAAPATAGDMTFVTTEAPDATVVVGRVVIINTVAYIVAEVTGTTVRIESGLATSLIAGTAVQFTTTAMNHEQGTTVSVLGAEPWEGFEFAYDWPDGQAYAQEWLDRHRRSSRVIGLRVFNRGDTWRSAAAYGSTHAINITTEGPITGVGKVIAFSPDEEPGVMEVIVEVEP